MKTVSTETKLHAYDTVRPQEVLSYGLGDAAFNLFWTPLMAFMMIYLTDVAGIAPAKAAVLLFVTRLAGAFADPVFAAMADRTQTAYGRFRPYFLWLGLPLAAAEIMAFSIAEVDGASRLAFAYVSLTLLNLIYAAANAPYNALACVITPDPAQRVQLMSARIAFSSIGALAISAFTPRLITFAGPRNQALGWQFAAVVSGVAAFLVFLNLFLNTRERFTLDEKPAKNPLTDIANLFTSRAWTVLFALAMVISLALTLRLGTQGYYMKYYAARPDLQAPFGMAISIGMAAGAVATSWLIRAITHKRLIGAMLVACGAASLVLYLAGPGQIGLMFALQGLTGLALGPVSVLTYAMYGDAADYIAWKTSQRATAMAYAVIVFAKKAGAALAPIAIGWALSSQAYVAGAHVSSSLSGLIRVMIALAPAVLCFAGALIISLYDLNVERVARVQAELLTGVKRA